MYVDRSLRVGCNFLGGEHCIDTWFLSKFSSMRFSEIFLQKIDGIDIIG